MSDPTASPEAFQEALLKWFLDNQRPLPWRIDSSLYRTVVSEFMLQQTQVKTMLPYFHRWMARFPDFEALAQADEASVLRQWEGLGYYSRARNIHRLAREVVKLSKLPRSSREWEALPGIGPYTAAAIASIAQGQPVAVVDGNVVRILARILGEERSFSAGEAITYFRPIARTLLNVKAPGNHNQAMMELGATICHKHRPLCTVCPVLRFCGAAKAGNMDKIPNLRKKSVVLREVTRFFIRKDDQILLHRIPESARRLAGQYELPKVDMLGNEAVKRQSLLLKKTRAIANERIREHIYGGVISADFVPDQRQGLHWISHEKLKAVTLSGPHRRWVEQLIAQ